MRILQVVPYFYPYGGPAGVAYGISKELVKRSHEVVMYTSNIRNEYLRIDSQSDDISGMKIHYIRILGASVARQMKLFVTPEIISKVKQKIKNFDVIHLHEYRTFQNVVIAHYAKRHGVPYVLQAHGSLPRIMAKKSLKVIYDVFFGYRLLRDASKVIALSQMEAEQYRYMGVPEEKIAVIPNGIDLSEYADLPPKGSFKKRFNIDEDEKIVLYLGRINKIKGLDILVKAFANIVGKLDDVKLVVVGPDDGYLDELKDLTKALKIEDNVLILGPLYRRNKLEAYVDAAVYVLPSRYEIWGMTVLEAVACGTPVILTENCRIAEHFKDDVALVTKHSSRELAKVSLEILQDAELRDAFRRNCRKVIGEFNISKIASMLEEVYEEVTMQPWG